jgi:hypothetical protein
MLPGGDQSLDDTAQLPGGHRLHVVSADPGRVQDLRPRRRARLQRGHHRIRPSGNELVG